MINNSSIPKVRKEKLLDKFLNTKKQTYELWIREESALV
jgi:hypothetical protein